MMPPEKDSTRLSRPKATQGDAAGEAAGQQGQGPFEEVVTHGQVGEEKGSFGAGK